MLTKPVPSLLRLSVPLVGGNCENGSKCGRYVNVDNVAGDAWWNIGASLYCPFRHFPANRKCDLIYRQGEHISAALAEN